MFCKISSTYFILRLKRWGPFHLFFQNLDLLDLGKASNVDKCHLAIPSVRPCHYQCVCKMLSKYSLWFKSYGQLLNFSQFGPRQSLDQWKMVFDKPLGYILSISMCMRNFIKIFYKVQETGSVSLFHKLDLGTASTDEK